MTLLVISLISSVVAILAGSPALYFGIKLRDRNKSVARLSLILFLALITHSLYHLLIALNNAFLASLMEAIAAFVIFLYAFYYWKLFRSDQG